MLDVDSGSRRKTHELLVTGLSSIMFDPIPIRR